MEILKIIVFITCGIPIGMLLNLYFWPRHYFLVETELRHGDIFDVVHIQKLSPKEEVWIGYTDYTIKLRRKRDAKKSNLFYENHILRTKKCLRVGIRYICKDKIEELLSSI